MSLRLESAVAQVRRVPAWGWAAVAVGAYVWFARPRPSGPTVAPMGSEDVQVASPAGAYNPVGAHAVGLPYDYAHLCPVTWTGRTRKYPRGSAGIVAQLAAPDPADSDGDPRVMYGRGAG